jgi:hypothetical protein
MIAFIWGLIASATPIQVRQSRFFMAAPVASAEDEDE